MARRASILICGLAACGRINFDPIGGDAITASFGETGTTTFANVTHDTILDATNPTFNYGAADNLRADSDEVGLLRFDLTALPITATIVSASLRLGTQNDSSAATIELRRVVEEWTEGDQRGAPGAANELERSSGVPWSTPFLDPVPLGFVQPITTNTSFDTPLPADLIGGWVADPATNFGIAVVTDSTDGVSFRSSTAAIPDTRPVLTVVYVP